MGMRSSSGFSLDPDKSSLSPKSPNPTEPRSSPGRLRYGRLAPQVVKLGTITPDGAATPRLGGGTGHTYSTQIWVERISQRWVYFILGQNEIGCVWICKTIVTITKFYLIMTYSIILAVILLYPFCHCFAVLVSNASTTSWCAAHATVQQLTALFMSSMSSLSLFG